MSNIPFVEKYRPTQMEDIILNNVNKTIINNIIDKKIYPNLLLYGPPGTGKTTTIINLVNNIQNNNNKSLLLHLNASDERGIDTIRNQIAKFINSKPLFSNGLKFIILDEVDYMTKSAQQALKFLLQEYSNKAVFCLMCNYISKIEISLKNEFIELKFNKLPKTEIITFLKNICLAENIEISQDKLLNIQEFYQSDIRSMVNCLQMNCNNYEININMLTKKQIVEFYNKIKDSNLNDQEKNIISFSINHNINPKNIFIILFIEIIKKIKYNSNYNNLIKEFELIFHDNQFNIYEMQYILHLFSLIKNISTM